MVKAKIFVFILMFLFASNVYSLETVALQGSSDNEIALKAEAEIQEAMTRKLASRAIMNLLGKSKYYKNLKDVDKIIKTKVDRFIPFINNGKLLRVNDHYKMVVTFKISHEDLKQILKQDGLFNLRGGDLSVLPMVIITDTIGENIYAWWLDSDVDNYSKILIEVLKEKFTNINSSITVVYPKEDVDKVPKKSSFSTSDYIRMGKKFDSNLVLVGSLKFLKDKRKLNQTIIKSKFHAISVSDGKIIRGNRMQVSTTQAFDMNKEYIYKLANDATNTIVSEVVNSWNNGEIGSDVIYVSLKGKVTYPRVEELKKVFSQDFPGVHSFKEHIFKKNEIIFKLETNSSSTEISKKLSGINLKNAKIHARFSGDRLSLVLK